ncbi:hypothetical protein BDN70DRAFT_841560, partial [Pholiota conissans]
MGHGTPLWLPEPNENRHLNYRRRGAAIGDVVYFTANGGLDFLFNICLDSDDPINNNNIPEGFSPFRPHLEENDTRRFQEYGEESYLASKSITKEKDRMGPAGLVFVSSASEGAILTMPEGVYSEDLARVSGFDRYLCENLESWYKYVNEVREWGVEMGELHLVTGVHKSKAWGIATFSNEMTTAMDLRMRFKSTDDLSTGRLYSWEYDGVVDSPRTGPTRSQQEAIFQGDDETQHQQFENQCLFVRTVNAAIRRTDAVKNSTTATSIVVVTGSNQQPDLRRSPGGPNPPSPSNSGQSIDVNTPTSEQSSFRLNFSVERNGPSVQKHPSKAINEFLLKEKPNGKIAITHDYHWASLLTKNDLTLPSGEEFVKRLKELCNVIEDENGTISLEYKDPGSNPVNMRERIAAGIENINNLFALQTDDTITCNPKTANKSEMRPYYNNALVTGGCSHDHEAPAYSESE